MPYGSILGEVKIARLCAHLESVLHLPGDILECGVFAGGFSHEVATRLKGRLGRRTLWACDTFTGIPPQSVGFREGHLEGRFGPEAQDRFGFTLDGWREHIARERLPIVAVQGRFEDTLSTLGEHLLVFSLLDADTFEATRLCWEFVRERTTPGGLVCLDDYRFERTPGVSLVANEMVLTDPRFQVLEIDPLLVRRKPCAA
jgi:hypothetical protein